jgi:hypothetical protein
MVGWIFVILIAVLMLYTADTVTYIITWIVSYLDAVFSAFGIHLEVFEYLDLLYPYFRSAVQVVAIGTIAVAILHIVLSIREQA